jgi:hypothetical protein
MFYVLQNQLTLYTLALPSVLSYRVNVLGSTTYIEPSPYTNIKIIYSHHVEKIKTQMYSHVQWNIGSRTKFVPGGRSWTEIKLVNQQLILPRRYFQLASVESLRVHNPRHRSSSETFFTQKIYSWTELVVNRGVREPRFHFKCIQFNRIHRTQSLRKY